MIVREHRIQTRCSRVAMQASPTASPSTRSSECHSIFAADCSSRFDQGCVEHFEPERHGSSRCGSLQEPVVDWARVSPLFGKRGEKAAQREAARAEIERLASLPAADLAVEIMPAFGPNGVRGADRRGLASFQIANWLVASFPGRAGIWEQLVDPVSEAIQRLEHAGLVQRTTPGQPGSGDTVMLTRLGHTALSEGSARRHLADG